MDGSGREVENPDRVLDQYLPALIFGDILQGPFDIVPRIGPGRRRVRIVRLPHDVIDADLVPERDASDLEPEVYVALAVEVFAWLEREPSLPEALLLELVVGEL